MVLNKIPTFDEVKNWTNTNISSIIQEEDISPSSVSTDETIIDGFVQTNEVQRTISSNNIDASGQSHIRIDSTGTIDTISNGVQGQILVLSATDHSTVTVSHIGDSTDEIRLDGQTDKVLDDVSHKLILMRGPGSRWVQLSYSDNY